MRFELYGILNESGHNVFIDNCNTIKGAIEMSKLLSKNTYPCYAIIEKLRKNCNAIGIDVGATGGPLLISHSLIKEYEPDPVRYAGAGEIFWKERFKLCLGK